MRNKIQSIFFLYLILTVKASAIDFIAGFSHLQQSQASYAGFGLGIKDFYEFNSGKMQYVLELPIYFNKSGDLQLYGQKIWHSSDEFPFSQKQFLPNVLQDISYETKEFKIAYQSAQNLSWQEKIYLNRNQSFSLHSSQPITTQLFWLRWNDLFSLAWYNPFDKSFLTIESEDYIFGANSDGEFSWQFWFKPDHQNHQQNLGNNYRGRLSIIQGQNWQLAALGNWQWQLKGYNQLQHSGISGMRISLDKKIHLGFEGFIKNHQDWLTEYSTLAQLSLFNSDISFASWGTKLSLEIDFANSFFMRIFYFSQKFDYASKDLLNPMGGSLHFKIARSEISWLASSLLAQQETGNTTNAYITQMQYDYKMIENLLTISAVFSLHFLQQRQGVFELNSRVFF